MSEANEVGGTPRRRRNLPMALALGAAVVAAAWIAVWATARSRLLAEIDRGLAEAARSGVVVACPDRAVGGFPFRMELSCASPGVEVRDRGLVASAQALRVVAQVWDPHLVIVELDGPATVKSGGDDVAARWRTLRASLRWNGDGVERLSIAGDGVEVVDRPAGRPPLRLAAEHVEAHGRPHGAGGHDLDLAASLAAASLSIGGSPVGPPRADVGAAATLVAALPPGPGAPISAFAARGGRIEPLRLSLSIGGLVLAGKGTLTLAPDGALDGTVGLAAQGLESLANGGAGKLGPELTTVVTAFVLAGKASADPDLPGRRLDMTIEHGRVRIGRVSLGELLPIAGARP